MAEPVTKPADAARDSATGGDETFLSRWSRRKRAAARPADADPGATVGAEMRPAAPATTGASATGAQHAAIPSSTLAPIDETPLPPLETLTFESDFTAFLRPGVDPDLRRSALRTLLRDPHFNTMDGLDVYIDDYTKPSPLAASTVAGMVQARYIFAPPATRVNAEGFVEDVPVAEAVDGSAEPPADATPADAPAADGTPARAATADAASADAAPADDVTDAQLHASPPERTS